MRSKAKDVQGAKGYMAQTLRGSVGTSIATLHDSTRKLKDFYDIANFELLGSGGFGQVYKAKQKSTGYERAIKRIGKEETDHVMVQAELISLLELDHPHVSKIIEWFEDDKSVYIVTELITGQPISNFVQGNELQPLFLQLMEAVTYCHEKEFAHRDLKPDNVLVRDDGDGFTLKVIDFGFAAIKKEDSKGNWENLAAGTPPYMPPEVIKQEEYTLKCDIWSAGVILYELVTGEHPFVRSKLERQNRDLVFQRIKSENVREEPLIAQGADEAERNIITRMLQKDATQRPKARELLQDPYLKGNSPMARRKSQQQIWRLRAKKHLAFANVYAQKADAFEKAILALIARSSDFSDIKNLRDTFRKIDVDGAGSITLDELMDAMKSVSPGSEENAARIFKAIDTAKQEKIEYTEWLAATLEPDTIASEEAAKGVMACFKTETGDRITKTDLANLIGEVKAEGVLNRLDSQNVGSLGYDELRHVLRSIADRRRCAIHECDM